MQNIKLNIIRLNLSNIKFKEQQALNPIQNYDSRNQVEPFNLEILAEQIANQQSENRIDFQSFKINPKSQYFKNKFKTNDDFNNK